MLSSKSVNKKGVVQNEIKIAMDLLNEFPSNEIFIIPVYLDECRPADPKLQDIHGVDLSSSDEKGLNYEKGLEQILRALFHDTS